MSSSVDQDIDDSSVSDDPGVSREIRKEIRQAEENIAEAREEERRAEAKEQRAEKALENAVERLEQIDERREQSEIIVNGRRRKVPGNSVSYEEVVKLAFPNGPTKPNTRFTVTYRNAAQVPAASELDPGQKVKVKGGEHEHEETVFNVTETVLS